jgi:hypothetical protein
MSSRNSEGKSAREKGARSRRRALFNWIAWSLYDVASDADRIGGARTLIFALLCAMEAAGDSDCDTSYVVGWLDELECLFSHDCYSAMRKIVIDCADFAAARAKQEALPTYVGGQR